MPAHRADGLVILPALSQAARIGAVLGGVATVPALDVLAIDAGSRGDRATVARAHRARVVSHLFNLGCGAVLQAGDSACGFLSTSRRSGARSSP